MVETPVSTSFVNIKGLLAVKHDQPESIYPSQKATGEGSYP
jgi:hypothetical protein